MPSDTAIIERITLTERSQDRLDERVKTVETGHRDIWDTINEMRKMVVSVHIKVAGIVAIGGFAQALLTAYLVYKITRG